MKFENKNIFDAYLRTELEHKQKQDFIVPADLFLEPRDWEDPPLEDTLFSSEHGDWLVLANLTPTKVVTDWCAFNAKEKAVVVCKDRELAANKMSGIHSLKGQLLSESF
jgi:hypothetical protein